VEARTARGFFAIVRRQRLSQTRSGAGSHNIIVPLTRGSAPARESLPQHVRRQAGSHRSPERPHRAAFAVTRSAARPHDFDRSDV